ncbi:hypothetical protein AAC387_Pa07g2122 [Persea americana]
MTNDKQKKQHYAEKKRNLLKSLKKKKKSTMANPGGFFFVREAITAADARKRSLENKDECGKSGSSAGKCVEDEEILQAICHYSQARLDDVVYNLNDNPYTKV